MEEAGGKMIVKDIKKVEKKDPKDYFLFEIYMESYEESPFLVAKSEMAEFGLHKGSSVNFDNLKELLDTILIRRGKGIALRTIARRNLTERELKDKLLVRNIPDHITKDVLDWLKELTLLNDESYTENYINYKGKQKSKRELMFALKGKGVGKEMVIETIEKTGFDEMPQAIELAVKKLRPIYNGEEDLRELPQKEINKIMGYLFRKGFSLDTCKNAIKEGFILTIRASKL